MVAMVDTRFVLDGVASTEVEIGRGAYGRVFEVKYKGRLWAAKEIHRELLRHAQGDGLQKIRDDFLSECEIWSTLDHPCLVHFKGVYYPAADQNQLPVMVMERMQLNLRGLVEKYNDIPIPLNVKLSILHDVCCGLSYLHGRNPPIVHRDLTPNNILLGHDLGAKISDLGIAKVLSNDRPQATMTKMPGTADFMPPECFQDKPNYGLPLDVFSYGGVVLYTITQQWPTPTSWFDSRSEEYLSESQRRQHYLDSMTGVAPDAPDLKPLVIFCLDNNPENRPKVDDIFTVIKEAKDGCSNSVTPAVWWAEELLKQDGKREEQQQARPQQQCMKQQQRQQQQKQQQKLSVKWKEGNPVPACRTGHSAVQVNGIIYVGGGDEDVLNQPSYKIDSYNTATESWGPRIDTPYCYFSLTCFEGYLTIVGGEDQRNVVTNKVLKLNEDNTLTDHIQQFSIPRSHTTAVGHNNFLIVIGGAGEKKRSGEGKRLASTEVYSSVTAQWRNCDNIPKALFNLKPVIANDELYLLGGCDQNGASPKVFVAQLDTLRGHRLRWHEFTTTPHLESAPVFLHTYLSTLGGRKVNDPTSDIALLDGSGCWEITGWIPSARIAPAVVRVGNNIVLIGGQDGSKRLTNTVWIGTCEPHVQ